MRLIFSWFKEDPAFSTDRSSTSEKLLSVDDNVDSRRKVTAACAEFERFWEFSPTWIVTPL